MYFMLLLLPFALYIIWFIYKCSKEAKTIFETKPIKTYYAQQKARADYCPLTNIASPIQEIAIRLEDPKFYEHSGLDYISILRAIRFNLVHWGYKKGASTITQQLARNVYLGFDKTLSRKFKEIFITLKLEKALSKAEILELYLNIIDYGNNCYGVKPACLLYFHKNPSELNLDEAIELISILPAPSKYNPLSPYKQGPIAVKRNRENLNRISRKRKAYNRLRNIFRKYIFNPYNQMRLKNKNISLIASNCNGACILHDLGLEYNSPFVNLYLMPKDFIKLCYNLPEYMDSELLFIKNSGKSYPVAALKDIKIYFMHYKTEAEALAKWQERKKRIDYNNLFFLFTDRDGCTEKDLLDFEQLPYNHKAVFVNQKRPDLTSAVYIPGFEKQQCVGVCIEYVNKWSIYKHYDTFDYVTWFNE